MIEYDARQYAVCYVILQQPDDEKPSELTNVGYW